MHNRFLQLLLRWFSSLFLHGTLLLFILSLCFVFIFGNRQVAKDVLIESDVYNQFIVSVIEDNRQATENKTSILPLDDPEITNLAIESFPPLDLKAKTDIFIDEAYDWLDGKKDNLSFTISFDEEVEIFIDRVSTYAANRLTTLPACTDENIASVTVFELTCRPENVPLQFVKDRVEEDLRATEFFQNMSITEQNLPKTENGDLLHEQLSFVPTINQLAKRGVWLFGIMFFAAALFFVYVRRPHRKGFKLLGRDLLSNGATFIVMTVLFGFIIPSFTNAFSVQGSSTVKLLNSISDEYVKRFDIVIINVALQIVAVAIVILALEKISRPASVYSSASKKSGVATSVPKKSKTKQPSSKLPPIQTSEVKKKPRKRTKKPAKYRKMGL
jgi:hypothetical protein